MKLSRVALYALLVAAALAVLFPILFSMSLALQGETVSPSLLPNPDHLDFSVFAQVFSKEPLMARWMLNSWVVSITVTAGVLLVSILPNYLMIAAWGWKDSYQALIVPFLASGFGIFLVPLTKPALATLGIWAFLKIWNQYYWPLLVIDNPVWRTTQVGITAFRAREIASYNLPMAATLIVLAPTVIVLLAGQKQLVEGLTAGAVKG